jgi:hypothetical protein
MKMEKVIFLDEDKLKRDLKEIHSFQERMNRTYQILKEFGIEDPEAVKTPLEAANNRLKQIISHDDKVEIDPGKAAELINKGSLYEELKVLNKAIVKNPFLDKVRWNKKQFCFRGNVEKELREEAAVKLINPKQIELHNRLEAFIKESEEVTNEFGVRYQFAVMVHFLPPFQIKNGKIIINHHIFLRQTKHLLEGNEAQKMEPKQPRISPIEKRLDELKTEALQRLSELEDTLAKKNSNGETGTIDIEMNIAEQRGILSHVAAQRKFHGLDKKPVKAEK